MLLQENAFSCMSKICCWHVIAPRCPPPPDLPELSGGLECLVPEFKRGVIVGV